MKLGYVLQRFRFIEFDLPPWKTPPCYVSIKSLSLNNITNVVIFRGRGFKYKGVILL
ncbi:hypothetical protein CAAN1_20S00210 [[Candida] anglica]|uniref:Uncharacterized protein n=1 Tax=[Candida] anglica TaxID=148631 RepID=A0ABP0EI91_9ASCO